ncbi:hypothetical protein [[Phormidium] sp. LEGE 05292]|nr:hypothetical protein [Phormidium sp. LEGE 05292]
MEPAMTNQPRIPDPETRARLLSSLVLCLKLAWNWKSLVYN